MATRTGLSIKLLLVSATFVAMTTAISGPALGQNARSAASDDNTFEVEMQDATQWMLEQPEPVRQAAGLLMDRMLKVMNSQSPDKSVDLESRIAVLLEQSKDPLNLALLAAICHQAGIQITCLDLGLAEAIVEHDQGNVISLAYLFPKDSDSFKEALLSSRNVDDYLFPVAEIWNLALEDYRDSERHPELRASASIQAMSIVMAIAIPGYASMIDACKNEIGESTLARACARISEMANHSSNSLMLRVMGLALARERALAANDEALAAQIQSERQNLQSLVSCIHQAIPEAHWSDDNGIGLTWIRSAAQLGEVAATEALGQLYNVDCPENFS